MINILKNDFRRMLCHKKNVMLTLFMTICMVSFAIYFTSTLQVMGNVAVVSSEKIDTQGLEQYYKITYLDEKPMTSELIENRYDAVIINSADGIKVETIKSDEFKNTLLNALANPSDFKPKTDEIRGIGTNIIGYLIMILMMQGNLYMEYFAEDKEKKLIEKISVTPIAFFNYLLAHCIYVFLMMFIPSFCVISIASLFGIQIGFSLVEFAGIIALLCLLSEAIGLFFNTVFNSVESANMIGSAAIILTSILGGTFYSYSHTNKIMNFIVDLLPQKNFISFVSSAETGNFGSVALYQFGYCVLIIIMFFVVSILINSKKYHQVDNK